MGQSSVTGDFPRIWHDPAFDFSTSKKKKLHTKSLDYHFFYISSIQSLGYYKSKYTPVGAELFLEAGQEKRLC